MDDIKEKKEINYWKLFFSIITGFYLLYCLRFPDMYHFIDSIDLVIHEGGHAIFIILGQFLNILGGSLVQVLLPSIISLYFYARNDYYSTAVSGMWVGYNIVNVSIYMKDAIAMQLPLLGGDFVIHDWNYLFTYFGILDYSTIIASVFYGIGMTTLIGSFIWSLTKISKTYEYNIN